MPWVLTRMRLGSQMTWASFWCCVRGRVREAERQLSGSVMMGDAGPGVRQRTYSAEGQDLRLFIVAGEPSGDALGAKLMAAVNERRRGRVRYVGVGGALMAGQGLISQFPLEDVAVMGPGAILAGLPRLLARVYGT